MTLRASLGLARTRRWMTTRLAQSRKFDGARPAPTVVLVASWTPCLLKYVNTGWAVVLRIAPRRIASGSVGLSDGPSNVLAEVVPMVCVRVLPDTEYLTGRRPLTQ